MMRKLLTIIIVSLSGLVMAADTVPDQSRKLHWRVGMELTPGFVPSTNQFFRGLNAEQRDVFGNMAASVRTDFSYDATSRWGKLYPGLSQGIGFGVNSFFAESLLGTPVSVYVYQGAPFFHFSSRLRLCYEWDFGATFGWKHRDQGDETDYPVVSTSVTALMGLGLKLQYDLTDRWQLTFGIDGHHYSNGNTHLPNAGVNTIGLSLGVAYRLSTPRKGETGESGNLKDDAPRKWLYDIMAYGAWRKRALVMGGEGCLCPGSFGVMGFAFSPLKRLNQWVAVGPSLDMKWDESAGLPPYWVEGTFNDDIRFHRPPFGKQLSAGISAHGELTTPVFAVNAGIGYDFISPYGENHFYQSLTLKTFVTKNVYLNVGYRLGRFKTPQNLMLGVGVRL